ncbi:MAG: hypothetical protein C0596_17815 [Marinilabiliales bacterium]|nr:MAG: hypothetical protein C0596_17815 [Marinilabiliales bacterium]
MIIPQDIQDFFDSIPFMALGTCDRDGIPNVSVIGSKKIVDDNKIWIIDTFFDKTKDNILKNKNVSISFWKGIIGYQIKGKAKYVESGEKFEIAKQWILKLKPRKIVKGLVIVDVTDIYSISANYEEAGKKI